MARTKRLSKGVINCYIPKNTKLKREEESLLEGGLVVYIYNINASRLTIHL